MLRHQHDDGQATVLLTKTSWQGNLPVLDFSAGSILRLLNEFTMPQTASSRWAHRASGRVGKQRAGSEGPGGSCCASFMIRLTTPLVNLTPLMQSPGSQLSSHGLSPGLQTGYLVTMHQATHYAHGLSWIQPHRCCTLQTTLAQASLDRNQAKSA